MTDLVLYTRKSIVIHVNENWRFRLLEVANKLARKGVHVETMLSKTCCLFANVDEMIDLGQVLKKFKMIEGWEES